MPLIFHTVKQYMLFNTDDHCLSCIVQDKQYEESSISRQDVKSVNVHTILRNAPNQS